MTHFPVLSSGAVCQFPVSKTREFRTIVNSLANGADVKLGDGAGERVRWRLRFLGLSEGEFRNIEDFYRAREGALETFLFLDPTDNLLVFSEDFTAGAWTKGPGLSLTPGTPGPLQSGLGTRVSNVSPAPQRMEQILNAPTGVTYCFSIYARGGDSATVTLVRRAGGVEQTRTVALRDDWDRLQMPWSPTTDGEEVAFGLELPAGATLELFGAQVECQTGASAYKKTVNRAGIYPQARFEGDSFVVWMDGVEQYRVTVDISARR